MSDDAKKRRYLAGCVVALVVAVLGGQHGGLIGWSLCVLSMVGFVWSAGAMIGRS